MTLNLTTIQSIFLIKIPISSDMNYMTMSRKVQRQPRGELLYSEFSSVKAM